MKVKLTTNLDWYATVYWPVLDIVPRKGELVHVHRVSENFCIYNDIPQELEVCSVIYFDDHVRVDLWYRKIDFELRDKNHLLKQ